MCRLLRRSAPVPDLCSVLTFPALPALLAGYLLQAPADAAAEVRHLLLDSRRVGLPAGAVFFALRGPATTATATCPTSTPKACGYSSLKKALRCPAAWRLTPKPAY